MLAAHAKTLSDKYEKIAILERQVDSLTQQLDWFQRQLFGRKSEKRRVEDLPEQPLLDGLDVQTPPKGEPAAKTQAITYTRAKRRGDDCMTDTGLRFAESVAVKTIEISAPELAGPDADEYEVIREKVTYRLAQAKSSYPILK